MPEEPPNPLNYAPDGGGRRHAGTGCGSFVIQMIGGFLAAVAVVLLLIPFTGPGPGIPAVLKAVLFPVGPLALLLVLVALFAHRRYGWRGFNAGVLLGLALCGLFLGVCAAMV